MDLQRNLLRKSKLISSFFFILGVVVPVLDFVIVAFFPSVQDEKIDIAQNQVNFLNNKGN
jgi:hypothetical protein